MARCARIQRKAPLVTTVIGIDPSLTATGVAVWRNGKTYSFTVRTTPEDSDDVRWGHVLARVWGECGRDRDQAHRTFIGIETLAPGMPMTGKMIERAGLLALLRYGAARRGHPVALVNPSTLKKFATGNGNAAKRAMMNAARLLLNERPDNDNEGDAVWVRTMALVRYGVVSARMLRLTTTQVDTIDVVRWPHWEGEE